MFYLFMMLLMSVGMVVLDDLLNGGVEVARTCNKDQNLVVVRPLSSTTNFKDMWY